MRPVQGSNNMSSVVRAIGAAKRKIEGTIQQNVGKVLDVIGRKADKYVPVDTGDLKGSQFKKVTGTGKGVRGEVGYSDWKATIVHERTDQQHAPPTCAKFLEKAIRETRGTTASIMGGRQLEIG